MRFANQRKLLTDLSRTWVLQRLKYISLSAVPSWLVPHVSVISRYPHSLGVGRLSLLVSGGTEHDRLLLTAAAALHDVGNGPFPHISDHIMGDLLGFKHEAALRFAFEKSPTKDTSIIENYGLDLEEIASVVQCEHRLSPLLNGRPDLDNLDNVHRFMMTIPGRLLGEASYQPSEIAPCFSIDAEVSGLPESLRSRWLGDWEKVYRHLWDDELNMVGWTILGRALRILKEELTPSFFTMTNREAFHLIKVKLPKLASGLIRRRYRVLLDRQFQLLRGEAQKLTCLNGLRSMEEELRRGTGLEEWAVGLTADQPFIREEAKYWRVYLVAYGEGEKMRNLKEILEDVLSKSIPYVG